MSPATFPSSAHLREKLLSLDTNDQAIDLDIARRTEALAEADVDTKGLAVETSAIARLHDQKRVLVGVRSFAEQRLAEAIAREAREALLAKVAQLEALQDERVAAATELQSLLPRVAELLVQVHQTQERCQQLAALPSRVLTATGWQVCEVNNTTVGDTAPTIVNDMLSGLAGAHWPFGERRGADLVKTATKQRAQYLAYVAAATGTDSPPPPTDAHPRLSARAVLPKQHGPLAGAVLVSEETFDAVGASRDALLRERAAAAQLETQS